MSIVKQIYDFINEKVQKKTDAKSKNKITEEEEIALSKLKIFKGAVLNYKNNYHQLKDNDQLSLDELLEKVGTSADEFLKKISELPEKNRFDYWECLSPLEDLNIVINA